jgi:hypothetical protein
MKNYKNENAPRINYSFLCTRSITQGLPVLYYVRIMIPDFH